MRRSATWSGMPSIWGKSETTRMILLTFCLMGLHYLGHRNDLYAKIPAKLNARNLGYSVEYIELMIQFLDGTPYLLSLGLSKSSMSAVWIAGPLSGLIVQPIIGVIADNSRSKWGRRRPFIIGGSFVVAVCLFIMGWTSEIVDKFVSAPESKAWWKIVVAIGSIYAIDFSINVVMSSSRSLIVDTLPISKQQLGNAWASRMAAIGHIMSYSIGTVDLRNIWGDWLGNSQFKQLCFIAAVSIIIGSFVTVSCVKERILISVKDADKGISAIGYLTRLFKTTTTLPPKIRGICWIQFWTWIGWFPFLFYSPTWVGETYFRYSRPANAPPVKDKLKEIGQIGSTSLVIFSIITFVASVVFPFLVRSPAAPGTRTFTPRPHRALAPILRLFKGMHLQRPDLLTSWTIANVMFGVLMLLSPLVRSVGFATVLVAFTGIPWAIAGWAPFALLGVEINRLSEPGRSTSFSTSSSAARHGRATSIDSVSSAGEPKQFLHLKHHRGGLLDPDDDSEDEGDEIMMNGLPNGAGGGSAPSSSFSNSSTGETAGIYLGVLNVFTTLPQFVGNFISMIVFAILEPGQDQEFSADNGTGAKGENDKGGVNAIAVCLCIGGASAMMGAYATRWLRAAR